MPIGKMMASPRHGGVPAAKMLAEALDILKALGTEGQRVAWLGELNAAATHNEALIEQAKTLIADANGRVTAAETAEAKAAGAERDGMARVNAALGILNGERASHAAAVERHKAAVKAHADQVKADRAEIEAAQTKLTEDRAALDGRKNAADVREAGLNRLAGETTATKARLDDTVAKLRALLSGL